eukprot:134718-Chlamydomonas_euryale.AAC.1
MSSLPGCQTSAAQMTYNCDGGNGGGVFFLHSCQASAAQTAHACNGGGGGGSNLAPLVGCQTSAAPLLQRCNGGDGFGCLPALSSLVGCQKLAAPMTCNAHRKSIGGVGDGCSAMSLLLRCQTSASLVPHSYAGGGNGGGGGLSLLGCQTSAAQMAQICGGGGGVGGGSLERAPLLQPLCGQSLFAADTARPAPTPLPRLEVRGSAAPGRGTCISCNDQRMLQLQAERIAGCPPYYSSVGMHAQTNAPRASE